MVLKYQSLLGIKYHVTIAGKIYLRSSIVIHVQSGVIIHNPQCGRYSLEYAGYIIGKPGTELHLLRTGEPDFSSLRQNAYGGRCYPGLRAVSPFTYFKLVEHWYGADCGLERYGTLDLVFISPTPVYLFPPTPTL